MSILRAGDLKRINEVGISQFPSLFSFFFFFHSFLAFLIDHFEHAIVDFALI